MSHNPIGGSYTNPDTCCEDLGAADARIASLESAAQGWMDRNRENREARMATEAQNLALIERLESLQFENLKLRETQAAAETERNECFKNYSAQGVDLSKTIHALQDRLKRYETPSSVVPADARVAPATSEPSAGPADPDSAKQKKQTMSEVVRVIQFGRDRYEWRLPEITGGELRRLCNIPGGDDVFRLEPSQDWTQHVGPPIEYDEIIPLPQMPPPMQASLRIVAIPRFIDGGFADARSVRLPEGQE